MSDVRAVLFDMDGVLYAYDFNVRMSYLEDALGIPAAKIREKIFDSGFEEESDSGRLSTEEYIDGIRARLGVDVTYGQWLAARKWAMAPDPAMLDLARRLKSKAEIAMLTNNGQFLADAIGELAPELPEIFGDRLFISGVVGLSKEYAAAFTALLARLGWQPESTLFIDDNDHYVGEARVAGLQTHLFEGIEGLSAVLGEAGLL